MPIGPITPGSPVTVTHNVTPALYTSIQGPSPSMPVIAQDVLDLSLVTMNVQETARLAREDLYQLVQIAFANMIQYFQYLQSLFSFTTTSTTLVDITGYEVNITLCNVGDQIHITWCISGYMPSGNFATLVPYITDAAGDIGVESSMVITAAGFNEKDVFSLTYIHTVAHAGPIRITCGVYCNNAGNAVLIVGNVNISAILRQQVLL